MRQVQAKAGVPCLPDIQILLEESGMEETLRLRTTSLGSGNEELWLSSVVAQRGLLQET